MSPLDIVILILLVSWLGGFSLHVAGSFIHILLVVAVVTLIVRLVAKR